MKAWLVLGTAVALGILASLASAGEIATFDTDLKIRDSAPAFHGKVKSDSGVCVADRKVKLFRKRRPGRPAKLLGSDRSNAIGRWAVLEPAEFTLTSGIYFAKTGKILDESTALPTFCLRDKSRRIVVD